MAAAARHRLLEGVLLRLARRPDADRFVVRGGVLLRHWLRPDPRPADDLDLVALFPFDPDEAARRFLPVLADDGVADGLTFDIERVRHDGIWLAGDTPGVRFFVTGEAGGEEVEFHADLTFGSVPRPAPVVLDLPTAFGSPARVWACRPEAVAGHKVQALWHRAMLGWRPKDLDDLRRLLARVPTDPTDLRAAVLAYLADVGGTPADARDLFGPGQWWGTKLASARWLDYAAAVRNRPVPRDLPAVAAEVAGRLAPALEGVA